MRAKLIATLALALVLACSPLETGEPTPAEVEEASGELLPLWAWVWIVGGVAIWAVVQVAIGAESDDEDPGFAIISGVYAGVLWPVLLPLAVVGAALCGISHGLGRLGDKLREKIEEWKEERDDGERFSWEAR